MFQLIVMLILDQCEQLCLVFLSDFLLTWEADLFNWNDSNLTVFQKLGRRPCVFKIELISKALLS